MDIRTTVTQLEGRVVGFGYAHKEDDVLHLELLNQLEGKATIHTLVHTVIENSVRLGEPSMARNAANWVCDNNVEILITAATRDHVDHTTAASIGRLCAALLGNKHPLAVLERTQPPQAVTAYKHPQETGTRTAKQPLLLSDVMGMGRLPHTPLPGPATYLWIPPDALTVVRVGHTTRTALR